MSGRTATREGYALVVHAARGLWAAVVAGERPDALVARRVVAGLSTLMAVDRRRFVAFAARQDPSDVRIHSHMANVAALTLLQADAFGIGGPLLSDFGVAALLHDIGKTRTPKAILEKPGRLTAGEAKTMQRHVLDGAAILRDAPGMPPLAAVVAFEHHLRRDGSGYPAGLEPRRLNVCTSMVALADVFDALRADRPYREGLVTARAHDVMNGAGATAFDPSLLKHFVETLGLSGPDRLRHPQTLTVESR